MREMRRKQRATTRDDALTLLKECEYAVLCLTDSDGNPHAVPVSPALDGETVYIHCAPAGYKLDCIAHNPQVCLCLLYTSRSRRSYFRLQKPGCGGTG